LSEADHRMIQSARRRLERWPRVRMTLSEADHRMIQSARRRLERWPRVRIILLVASVATVFFGLLTFSVALKIERPESMTMLDRFVCVAISTLSFVVAAVCTSRVLVGWNGNKLDRLVVTLADETRELRICRTPS